MRRAWFDPRLAIGAVLVIVSIVGVWLVIQATSRSTTVWVASETMLPGDVIGPDDVEPVELRMDGADDVYLDAGATAEGLVVVRPVEAGEALPLAALGAAVSVDTATVVIATDGGIASSIRRGATVDLWAAPPTEQGAFGSSTVLVADAIVVGVVADEGIIADDAVQLELLVPTGSVGAVLDAVSNDHAVTVVPVAQDAAP